MKRSLLTLLILMCVAPAAFSQEKVVGQIKDAVVKNDLEAHITFLAADEMRGRGTGSPEIAIAANYLATQFMAAGAQIVPGMSDYFQTVGLIRTKPTKAAELVLGSDHFVLNTDIIIRKSSSIAYSGDIVFVGYGTEADFQATDVRGKVVLAYMGSSAASSENEAFSKDARAKYKLASDRGAAAIVEIVTFTSIPWPTLAGFFSDDRITLAQEEKTQQIPHIFLRKSPAAALDDIISQKYLKGSLSVEASTPTAIEGKNVICMIPGTDSKLKKEYVSLTAHYDHVGVLKNTKGDSINNGARDNVIGTVAIVEAAHYFAKHPAKRPILIIAYCAEEVGLLGSKWYTDHPVIPLANTIFNMDCDGAGYNDKSVVTVIDLKKTTADELLDKAAAAFRLHVTGDPVPEQSLYSRSDNYNFAVKGVPAIDFAPGFTSFDTEILKYYHTPADEANTLDFDYLEKYMRAYVYAAALIADAATRPTWKPGDEFEEAGKKLYGIK